MTSSLFHKILPAVVCGILLFGVSPVSAQSIALPGTIEIENFDQGNAGVAYSDTTGGNSGGQYRATDVDIESTADATGGFNIGWVYPGEWLRYTVNVPAAGAYALEFRVAAPGAGGSFHIEANGVNVTGPVSIPSTGGWQTWTTVTRSAVNLTAGSQTWRLVIDAAGASGVVGNFNYIRVTGPAASASSAPYTGTPVSLPGTLQIENFDIGGEGVAYHDLSNGNDGGQYRPEGVDVEATTDTGGGYHAGYAFATEWLAYTVDVASAGTYDIEARVASNGAGGTFHIEINGVDRTGPFTVPNTGGWGTWTTIRKTGLALSAGRQVWRLVMDTNGPTTAVGNLNYLRIVAAASASAPYSGTPITLPGTVQIENFDNGLEGVAFHDLSAANEGGQYRSTGVDIEQTTDAGGGYHVGWAFAGEWLRYSVNVTTAGTYDVEVRVASNGTGGTFHLDVNGVDRTGPFTVPNTGGWQTWATLRRTGLALSAGPQVFRLVMDTNGPTTAVANLNYLRIVSPGSANQPPAVSITRPTGGATFTAPASIAVDATASDDGSVARVEFYAGTQLIGTDTTAPYSVTWGNVAAGSYSLTAVAYDTAGASTSSAAVAVTVGGAAPAPTPTSVAFTPSPDHNAGVTSYAVIIYRASDRAQVATTNLGKPTPVNNEIRVDISGIVNPLPAGSYYAVVTAGGATGTSTSAASANFTK